MSTHKRLFTLPSFVLAVTLFAAVLSVIPAAAGHQRAHAAAGFVRAGVGVVDATWHVGASAGQYAGDPLVDDQELPPGIAPDSDFDPHRLSHRRSPSYGVQTRLSARAVVVEGSNGVRVALVKNDQYIPQDMLWRRTAQILEANGTSGIDRAHLTTMSSHSHSSPFYSSTTWGPWAFQDGFDFRFFEYMAQAQAQAVEQAAAHLVPARVGASVSYFDKTHRHSYGPAVADDGTPAGFPQGETDHDMMIVRFDDISNPAAPKSLAVLANFGLHGEFLEGNDLISADYVGPLERMIDRETGAVLIWSQGSTGTAEPERSTYHSIHERLEFSHKDYAQAEYGARLMATAIEDTFKDIAQNTPEQEGRFVPFSSDFPVTVVDKWFPGPTSHPYPGVSSCRTDQAFTGNPRLPIVGLPDCEGPRDQLGFPPAIDPGIDTDTLEAAGVPIPENYSAPSYGSLEESIGLHLQAVRLGDLLLTICSCEQWSEQTKDVKTRTDLIPNNIWYGWDWTKVPGFCTQNADTTWSCKNPGNPAQLLPPVTDHEYQRMRAQINNDANGWNDLSNVAWAESEPVAPAQIRGNFTHVELPPSLDVPGGGYRMTMTIGMANDYNGYIASYREYQRGDHYRKALTGWGAHSSDYIATRLVQMGGFLRGGAALAAEPLDPKEIVDQLVEDAKGVALGAVAEVAIPAYEAILPDDGGPVVVRSQPADITRFSGNHFSWIGGSNYTDNPMVKVQRLVNGAWQNFADQSGEIITTLVWPKGPLSVVPYLQGATQWEWTAHFEAFSSNYQNLGARPGSTPVGRYRFVVDGLHRAGRQAVPYHVESREFVVSAWRGITVQDLRVDADHTVSLRTGPTTDITVPAVGGGTLTATIGPIDYPDSYTTPLKFIRLSRSFMRDPAAVNDPSLFEWYCLTCSFRPWADTGVAKTVKVTINRLATHTQEVVSATLGADGRWHTAATLLPGDKAFVLGGGIQDAFGNTNGATSAMVTAA